MNNTNDMEKRLILLTRRWYFVYIAKGSDFNLGPALLEQADSGPNGVLPKRQEPVGPNSFGQLCE